jgi:hypothetical protein
MTRSVGYIFCVCTQRVRDKRVRVRDKRVRVRDKRARVCAFAYF